MSYALVKQAIIDKKPIHAYYDGRYREMCPHVIGLKNGKEQALCYQYGGESKSRPIQADGSKENWRCVEIARVSGVEIVDGPWHTAPDHSRPQTCVDDIDVEVVF